MSAVSLLAVYVNGKTREDVLAVSLLAVSLLAEVETLASVTTTSTDAALGTPLTISSSSVPIEIPVEFTHVNQ